MGHIIYQKPIDGPANVTALELMLKTLDAGAAAFQEMLPSLLDGSYPRRPMPHKGRERPHRSTDVPNGGVLDASWSLAKAHAFLRALDYGRVPVFPAPKVRQPGGEFLITGYQYVKNAAVDNNSPAV